MNKCKDNQNHSLSLMILYCWICGTSMGKVGLCTPTESRTESGMSSHYWMSKANKREYHKPGIAPPEIRRSVCARVEWTKQVERETHSLFGYTPARRRLKSRGSFLTSVQPVYFPAKVVRVNEWKRRLEEKAHAGLVNLYEDLATGHDSPWLNWRCLNRLRTGYTCSKETNEEVGIFQRRYKQVNAA